MVLACCPRFLNMSNIETRKIHSSGKIEIRAVQSGVMLSGYAAIFNQVTQIFDFDEQVLPGAFKRSLDEGADVRALYNHQDSDVIARRSGGTLELTEDSKGLSFRMKVPNTQAARDLVENIRHGNISGMSMGFVVQREEWREAGDRYLRSLVDVELIEISPVTFPAYEGTSIIEI